MKKKFYLIFIAAIFLAGCQSTTIPKVQLATLLPSETLLHCQGAPASPPKPRTQRDIAFYILTLREAHADCAAKLSAIEEWTHSFDREAKSDQDPLLKKK